jgi:pyruvate formate lyase activating enzyme
MTVNIVKDGIIFDIQQYSIHDGPGIRTTVFFKGCPLHCPWCQNPESKLPAPQIWFDRRKCTGCGACVVACPQKVIEIIDNKSKIDISKCTGCGACSTNCPNEARKIIGKRVSAQEVFKAVNDDRIFYEPSGGGVTLSGGEPLVQPEFALDVLKLCKEHGLHTALETCGFASWETFSEVLNYTDLVLFDLKHMDSAAHIKYTGVPNQLILSNLTRINKELSIPILARIPVIPGYNNSEENISSTAKFIVDKLNSSVKVHLLAYHRLGESKYEQLGLKYETYINPPSEEEMIKLKEIIESFGLTAFIGG